MKGCKNNYSCVIVQYFLEKKCTSLKELYLSSLKKCTSVKVYVQPTKEIIPCTKTDYRAVFYFDSFKNVVVNQKGQSNWEQLPKHNLKQIAIVCTAGLKSFLS